MNEAQHTQNLNDAAASVQALAQQAFDKLKKEIGNGKEAASVTINRIIKDYAQEVQDLVQTMAADYMAIGTKTAPLTTASGVALSDALYHNAALTVTPVVTRLINESAKQITTARELSRLIYEGYNFQDDPLKVQKELPAYLVGNLKKAIAQAKTLKTPSVKAAYLQALVRIEKGAHQQAIDKALQVAFYERNRYYANRIAQTELHRIHSDTIAQELMQDDGIHWVQIRMSATHPKYDICDYHSKLNAYGKGAGVYPKAKAPKPPYHPHCRCKISPRVDLDPPQKEPVRNQSAERTFIKSLSKGEQVAILGSELKRVQYLNDVRLNVLDIVDKGKPNGYETGLVGDVMPAIIAGMKQLDKKQFSNWFTSATKESDSINFAQLNDSNRIALGSLTNVVFMSGETAAKQRLKHDDLTDYHYEQLSNNINYADVVVLKNDGHKLVFFFIDEKLYEAIIKATKDKKELYLVSFYRAEMTKIDRESRHGTVITDKRDK